MYFYLFNYKYNVVIFRNSSMKSRQSDYVSPVTKFANEPWFTDMQKLSNDELMRMYNAMITGRYEFAKHAWYIPLAGDLRCPIMVAKGYNAPDTPEKMVGFQETTKILEQEYQRFIDAWDFDYISKRDIQNAIMIILELRSIKILELCTKTH
jgi:integrase